MILLFDIGNTNIVLGIVKNNEIVSTYRFVTESTITEDDYYQKIDQALKRYDPNYQIDGVAISSVVPSLDNVMIKLFIKYYTITPLLIAPKVKSGLKIMIENPKQTGADLICTAIGAYEKYGGPTIIVDLGTATKLTVVNQNKEFLGGAICPGIIGSLNSLITSAAKLSSVKIQTPEHIIEKDTSSCIQSGVVFGHASMIDGMVQRMKNELYQDHINVVLTGGLASTVQNVITTKYFYEPNILLEGLLYIYNKNK